MEEEKRKLYKYLKENRANHDILQVRDKDTNRELMVSVNSQGVLYCKKGSHITDTQQKRYWEALFYFSIVGEHNIVPEGFWDE